MKGFKKKLAGLLVFAMMLSLFAPALSSKVQAADTTPEVKIYFDSGLEQLGIDVDTSKSNCDVTEISYADASKGKEVYEVAEYIGNGHDYFIDLSWVAKTKDAKIKVKVDFSNSVASITKEVSIKAQEKKLKVGLMSTRGGTLTKPAMTVKPEEAVGSADTGYLYFYIDKSSSAVSPSSIEWKKGVNGNWKPVSELDDKDEEGWSPLKQFLAKGATLYFRQNTSMKEDEYEEVEVAAGTTLVWPSKEVKYSYKKQANAPKITLDAVNNSIKLKAGQEYKVYLDGEETAPGWISVNTEHNIGTAAKPKVGTISVNELRTEPTPSTGSAIVIGNDIYSENVTVKVRTNNGKSVPSKATSAIAITPVANVSQSAISVIYAVSGEAFVSASTGQTASSGDVKIYWSNKADSSKGMIIESSKNIQYAVKKVDSTKVDTLDPLVLSYEKLNDKSAWAVTWKAINSGKKATLKKDYCTKDYVILIRMAGDKTNKNSLKMAGMTQIFALSGTMAK